MAEENVNIVGAESTIFVEPFFPNPPVAEVDADIDQYSVSYPDDYKHQS